MSQQTDHNLAQIRDQLLNSFTAPDLYDLFLYTDNPNLRPLTQRINRKDTLVNMLATATTPTNSRSKPCESSQLRGSQSHTRPK